MVSSKQEVNTLLNKCYENSVLRLQGAPSPGWGASLQRSHVKNEQHSDRQVVKQCPRKVESRQKETADEKILRQENPWQVRGLAKR